MWAVPQHVYLTESIFKICVALQEGGNRDGDSVYVHHQEWLCGCVRVVCIYLSRWVH